MATAGADAYARGFWAGLEPEPEYLVSEWADTYRELTGRSSAEPGRWRTSRFPFTREIMDALSAMSPIQRMVWMGGRQTGKTETGLNWIGYVMHHAPGPMLMVQPSGDMAKRVSKQRIEPMIRETPVLASRVRPSRSRDSGNTLLAKEFTGGILLMTGSHSSAAVRSMPIRYLFLDEVDEYEASVEGQGDVLSIAEECTNNFPNRKILITGNPGIRGESRIEKEYLRGDQRRYFIPCPECGHFDFLTWTGFRDFVTGEDGGHHRIEWEERDPMTAHMTCGGCGAAIEEQKKTWMLANGEWRPTAEGDGVTRSYQISSLYSPAGFRPWSECARKFLKAKEDTFLLRAFVNNVLGETWEERGEAAGAEDLISRVEQYQEKAEIPPGVGVLVASVDVQDNRLEAQVKGYGAGEESWLIAYQHFMGDPAHDTVWHELDRFLAHEFEHESGRRMKVERVAVDSGGHRSEQVYRYCKARTNRGVFAVRGGKEVGRPVVGKPTLNNRYRTPLFTLCVDTAKEMIYSRLKIRTPGPGYCHLPNWVDEEYIAQLTAEKGIRRYRKGRGSVREWVKTRDRNEALDLEVYCLAALYILGPAFVRSLPERAARLSVRIDAPPATPDPGTRPPRGSAAPRPRRPGGSWIKGWR